MADALQSAFPHLLWWVPLLPLIAAGVIAFLPDRRGRLASRVAIGGLGVSCLISLAALLCSLDPGYRLATSVDWFTFGGEVLQVGLLLDPMSGAMIAMVSFVALWIFIFSLGYMADEKRFGRFFGFLSLFCGAMLMLVLSNSLLLLFMAWELVGLASYLLIGFYFEKPSAAAAAQKAFITTRIGDVAFLLGLIWLYRETGTLLFYDGGSGLLESGALATLAGATTVGGLAVSAGASLLLLIGAMGKSGQVPLHVWLPDAMEGPTPVSALIHAATMVAAGVFLVARTHPIFAVTAGDMGVSLPLAAAAWIGGITALYAALVAVAQTDIKRILAYSTVSQLGFMMVALGTGGVGAAMFHLIAHAFFKALLFLSAGSVIHGCHHEQDIRKMGGLSKRMPKTFIAYAIGMMALSGFPFVFSGFWSKEAIFHSAMAWPGGKEPLVLTVCAALLTAFYMTRQALLVFFGGPRSKAAEAAHESPKVMVLPLYVLGAGAVLLALVGTPAWPWFEKWIEGEHAHFHFSGFWAHGGIALLALSLVIVTAGVGMAWKIYRKPPQSDHSPDPLESKLGVVWKWLSDAFGVDAFYENWVIEPLEFCAGAVDAFERMVMVPLMDAAEKFFKWFGRCTKASDDVGINKGFDGVCDAMKQSAAAASRAQGGRPQVYLRAIGLGAAAMLLLYFWFSVL